MYAIPKTTQNFKIVRLDGTTYDMREVGIGVNLFSLDPPKYKHNREDDMGELDGFMDMGTTIEGRTMSAQCRIYAQDLWDFPLLVDEVHRIFDSRQPFWLIRDAQPGKRWLVKCENMDTVTQKTIIGEFTLSFISSMPYAESVGSSLTPMTFDAEVWQIGQGLISEELTYTHTTNSFQIFNAGDMYVDPRDVRMDFTITFQGASSNLKIINDTTGETWNYYETTTSSDVMKLQYAKSLKNNNSVFKYTNRKLLRLAPGFNDIRVVGNTGAFSITFDFHFYYVW